MPIQISPIPSMSLKEAIERMEKGENIMIVTHEVLDREIRRIAREAQALQRPTTNSYVTGVPGVNDLNEVQELYVVTGGVTYKYTKVAGVIKYWALT